MKNDLRPFYEALSGDIIDKKKVAEIIWQGEGSCFTAADYWAARKSRDKDNLETRALLKLGYSVFEDKNSHPLSNMASRKLRLMARIFSTQTVETTLCAISLCRCSITLTSKDTNGNDWKD